jgi:hypothetical protein
MPSVLKPRSQLDPAVKGKIARVKMLGIPCVIVLFLGAVLSAMGYLPRWVFWTATSAEIFLGPYLIRKMRLHRNPS